MYSNPFVDGDEEAVVERQTASSSVHRNVLDEQAQYTLHVTEPVASPKPEAEQAGPHLAAGHGGTADEAPLQIEELFNEEAACERPVETDMNQRAASGMENGEEEPAPHLSALAPAQETGARQGSDGGEDDDDDDQARAIREAEYNRCLYQHADAVAQVAQHKQRRAMSLLIAKQDSGILRSLEEKQHCWSETLRRESQGGCVADRELMSSSRLGQRNGCLLSEALTARGSSSLSEGDGQGITAIEEALTALQICDPLVVSSAIRLLKYQRQLENVSKSAQVVRAAGEDQKVLRESQQDQGMSSASACQALLSGGADENLRKWLSSHFSSDVEADSDAATHSRETDGANLGWKGEIAAVAAASGALAKTLPRIQAAQCREALEVVSRSVLAITPLITSMISSVSALTGEEAIAEEAIQSFRRRTMEWGILAAQLELSEVSCDACPPYSGALQRYIASNNDLREQCSEMHKIIISWFLNYSSDEDNGVSCQGAALQLPTYTAAELDEIRSRVRELESARSALQQEVLFLRRQSRRRAIRHPDDIALLELPAALKENEPDSEATFVEAVSTGVIGASLLLQLSNAVVCLLDFAAPPVTEAFNPGNVEAESAQTEGKDDLVAPAQLGPLYDTVQTRYSSLRLLLLQSAMHKQRVEDAPALIHLILSARQEFKTEDDDANRAAIRDLLRRACAPAEDMDEETEKFISADAIAEVQEKALHQCRSQISSLVEAGNAALGRLQEEFVLPLGQIRRDVAALLGLLYLQYAQSTPAVDTDVAAAVRNAIHRLRKGSTDNSQDALAQLVLHDDAIRTIPRLPDTLEEIASHVAGCSSSMHHEVKSTAERVLPRLAEVASQLDIYAQIAVSEVPARLEEAIAVRDALKETLRSQAASESKSKSLAEQAAALRQELNSLGPSVLTQLQEEKQRLADEAAELEREVEILERVRGLQESEAAGRGEIAGSAEEEEKALQAEWASSAPIEVMKSVSESHPAHTDEPQMKFVEEEEAQIGVKTEIGDEEQPQPPSTVPKGGEAVSNAVVGIAATLNSLQEECLGAPEAAADEMEDSAPNHFLGEEEEKEEGGLENPGASDERVPAASADDESPFDQKKETTSSEENEEEAATTLELSDAPGEPSIEAQLTAVEDDKQEEEEEGERYGQLEIKAKAPHSSLGNEQSVEENDTEKEEVKVDEEAIDSAEITTEALNEELEPVDEQEGAEHDEEGEEATLEQPDELLNEEAEEVAYPPVADPVEEAVAAPTENVAAAAEPNPFLDGFGFADD